MLFPIVGRLALAGVLSAFACPCHAEALTLQAAIGRTLTSNPALRAERAPVEAFEQQLHLDSLAPALTLDIKLESLARAGAGAFSNVDGSDAYNQCCSGHAPLCALNNRKCVLSCPAKTKLRLKNAINPPRVR